ncbi:MAG: ATP-binding protein, partial [Hungatella sp.]
KHTEKYIDLINHRTREPIEFVTLVSPDLLQYPIVRFILQPCVENCIKHAFDSENGEILILHPFICISIAVENSKLVISIEDNGKGIDTEAALAAIFHTQSSSKVGLKNIYERLNAYYEGTVKVEFSSIPFHKNIITFICTLSDTTAHTDQIS